MTTKETRKRVLVIGASGGIGYATAAALIRSGFHVTLHGNNNFEKLKEVESSLYGFTDHYDLLQFDIANREETKMWLERTMNDRGAFYGVALIAGVNEDAPFPALTPEAWDKVIRTNLDGFYNVIQPLIMPMINERIGGRIVTLSSISGQIGNRGQVNYSASKAGIIGATKALAQELAKRAITVNCVAPGIIETNMIKDINAEEITRLIPARRLGKPEEVADLIDFLFSDKASYITGQVIGINGGMI